MNYDRRRFELFAVFALLCSPSVVQAQPVIMRDGHATLANAGHINPYRAGHEVDVANGPPLGLQLHAAYEETELTLAEGDTLTLLTDGVVEAQDSDTKALFGFERTAAISGGSAEQIAEAARSFGQEDDIAVLTLQYLPV